MPLCQLIHKEIQKISGFKLDLKNLDPREYDEFIVNLYDDFSRLTMLQKILDLKPEYLDKIEAYLRVQDLDQPNLELRDLFADQEIDITDKTIFFIGDLYFKQYQLVNPNPKVLPTKLKFIFGKLDAFETDIESLCLEYVSYSIYVSSCKNLKEVELKQGVGESVICSSTEQLTSLIIGNVGKSVICMHCFNLVKLVIGDVLGNLDCRYCYSLSLENISSIHGTDHKITVGRSLLVGNSGLSMYSVNKNEAFLAKFESDTFVSIT